MIIQELTKKCKNKIHTAVWILFFISSSFSQDTLFISPFGDDRNSGTSKHPFATLERTRDEIRLLKKNFLNKGYVVVLQPGYFILKTPFILGPEDSGDSLYPILYTGLPDNIPHVIGGIEIKGFHVTSGENSTLFDLDLDGKVYVTDILADNVTDFGELSARGFSRGVLHPDLEFFFNEKPMQLARWPNKEWALIDSVPEGPNGGKFIYKNSRLQRWGNLDDVWMHGFWGVDWADSYEKIKSINISTWEIATFPPHGVYGYKKGQRFYVINLLEELDEPGEWYLDRVNKKLYFYAPEPIQEKKAFLSMVEVPLIQLNNTQYLTIQNLTIEYTREAAIQIANGKKNSITNCTIRNVGTTGVTIRGGESNTVKNCDIYDVGSGGISIYGGNRKTLISGNNSAEGNTIFRFGRRDMAFQPGIYLNGVGNRAVYNQIHNAPHSAIIVSGNDNIIEFNNIHDVCMETGDAGAFYIGRDWTMRGNIVRYNYFHDIYSPYLYGASSVYLDDLASGTLVYGNVFSSRSKGVLVGGGRDNIIDNNVFIRCNPSIHVDARGTTWASLLVGRGGAWKMHEKLESVNFDKPPYSIKYPKLANILNDDPGQPKGNIIVHNVSAGGLWMNVSKGIDTLLDFGNNLVQDNSASVISEKYGYHLKIDPTAFGFGFKPIPIEKIAFKPKI